MPMCVLSPLCIRIFYRDCNSRETSLVLVKDQAFLFTFVVPFKVHATRSQSSTSLYDKIWLVFQIKHHERVLVQKESVPCHFNDSLFVQKVCKINIETITYIQTTRLHKVGTMWTPYSTMQWFRLRRAGGSSPYK